MPLLVGRMKRLIFSFAIFVSMLVLCVVIAMNWDEDLHPEYKNFFYDDAPVDDNENVFYLLQGLDAPTEKELSAYGKNAGERLQTLPKDYSYILRPQKLKNIDCWIRVTAFGEQDVCKHKLSKQQLRQLIADNQKMLNRYEYVQRFRRFQQNDFNRLHLVNNIMYLHELYIADLVLQAKEGRAIQSLQRWIFLTEFLQELLQDKPSTVSASIFFVFHKLNMESYPLIVEQISAENLVQYKKRLLSIFDRAAIYNGGYNITANLRSDEGALDAVDSEIKDLNNKCHLSNDCKSFFLSNITEIIYKPNATRNLYYAYAKNLERIAKLPPLQAKEAIDTLKVELSEGCDYEREHEHQHQSDKLIAVAITRGVNGLGKELLCELMTNHLMLPIIQRHHAMRQMLKLYTQARIDKISQANMPDYVASSVIRNPLNAKPFEFNVAKNTMILRFLNDDKNVAFEVPYAP